MLGKPERTVREMARTGKLPARRVGHTWVIDKERLTGIDPAALQARAEQTAAIRQRVDAALERAAPPAGEGGRRPAFSVQDTVCGRTACGILAELHSVQGAADAAELEEAKRGMRCFLRLLADGIHQFEPATKVDRFVRARSEACATLGELLALRATRPELPLGALIGRIEQDLLGPLRGMIRRTERRGR